MSNHTYPADENGNLAAQGLIDCATCEARETGSPADFLDCPECGRAPSQLCESVIKPFHEMTADEIAEHREKWRRGEAEIWRGTTARPSIVTKGRLIYSDHEAPTREMCLQAMASCVGYSVVTEPHRVSPLTLRDGW